MPIVEIIMDYFLQYMGTQFIKQSIDNMALWFTNFFNTQIVKYKVRQLLEKNNNLIIHRDTNFLVLNKPPNILINSNDPSKVLIYIFKYI